MSDNASPPGWHPDAQNPGQERYWDGSAWTEQRRPVQGPPPPGMGYQQAAPPKQKHTLRNVLLISGLVLILFCGGCLALGGSILNEAGEEIDKALEEEAENDKPKEVTEGQAFEHDGYKVDAGWKVGADEFGYAEITGVRVTNTEAPDAFDGSGRSALLTFTFYRGTENLLEVNCTGNELQEGESTTLDCGSLDKLPKDYDTIKVADLL